jgi:hypothetical protein
LGKRKLYLLLQRGITNE